MGTTLVPSINRLYSIFMEMIEIWAPELVVVVFLALPLFRPFIKKLWPLDGLVWLPLVALGIIIGIFPAYGFRPECLPVLVFALVYNTANLFPIISGASSRPSDSFRDRGPLLTIFVFILLSAAVMPMFAFSSRINVKAKEDSESIKVLKISSQTGDYFLRVYGTVQPDRPLILVVPPEIGSAASVDMVCTELQKKNFSVITYSSGEDNFLKLLTYGRIFKDAVVFASANEQGKALEAERRTEIEFVLSRLPAALGDTGNGNLPPLLLVGYGAGGSALAYLAGESDFISLHHNVLGVIAIESRLWSAYLPETRHVPVAPFASGMIRRHWVRFVFRLGNIRPQRVSRNGPLPGAELLNQGLPVLYLISGRALNTPQGQKPYQAVFDALRSSSGPVALAASEGAGPLDFQDYPFTHPLYSFLLPGLKGAQQSADPIGDTASIIGNFGSLLLEQAEQPEINIPPRQAINGALYVESKGLPGFRF